MTTNMSTITATDFLITLCPLPALVEIIVHADPCECDQAIEYHPTTHHHYLAASD